MIALLSFHQIPCRRGDGRARPELLLPILPLILSTGDSNVQGVHPLWRRRGEEGCNSVRGRGVRGGNLATKTGNRRGIEGDQQNAFTMRTAVTLSQPFASVYERLRVFASDYECQRAVTSVNERLRVSTSDYECQRACVYEWLRVFASVYKSFLELNFNRWTDADRAADSVRGAGRLCAAVEKAGLVWLASERCEVCSRHSVKPGVVDV